MRDLLLVYLNVGYIVEYISNIFIFKRATNSTTTPSLAPAQVKFGILDLFGLQRNFKCHVCVEIANFVYPGSFFYDWMYVIMSRTRSRVSLHSVVA